MLQIKSKTECCGCSACANVCPTQCIKMKADNEGFLYPSIDEKLCLNCSLCEEVCPILNKHTKVEFEQQAFIVQNRDEKVLRESTSGGAFTAIAEYILQLGGVVFGVEFTKANMARHICVDNREDLWRFRNSKYVQSVIGNSYKQTKNFLEEGRYVCFSGTPCQIEGLKRYLKKEYERLVTVDVVCRAVPSPMILKKYIEYQEIMLKDTISQVRFRDKYYGYKYSTMNIVTANNKGDYHKGVESDPWLRAFFENICDRPSCHDCKFRDRYRESDFTIWDCFNVARFSKELDNDRGATRMLVNTKKGVQVFREISKKYSYVEMQPEEIINGSKEMYESPPQHEKREEFFFDANILNGKELFEKYFPETILVKTERIIRLLCFKLGIYSFVKKIIVRVLHKY